MPVPDFQSLMLPILKTLSENEETSSSEIRNRVMTSEGLTKSDTEEMLPSGKQSVFTNRVAWALSHMRRADLVLRARRGIYKLTPEGTRLLSNDPLRVDMKTLNGYESYRAWSANTGTEVEGNSTEKIGTGDLGVSPTEVIEKAFQSLKEELAAELLSRIRNTDPKFLEQIVVDLLIAMGYGGGDSEMGRVVGQSGDHGIDGTIREDKLGLDEVYIQAKNYAPGNKVGEGDLRNFVGAIVAAGTSKGVFVTTSEFTPAAKDFVNRSPTRIVLIDGDQLAHYMIDYNVGVRTGSTYVLKHPDDNYFEPEYP